MAFELFYPLSPSLSVDFFHPFIKMLKSTLFLRCFLALVTTEK